MYLLTKKEGDLESGTFASVDEEGTPIIQFFEDKDDAITYSTYLEAIDQEIAVSEIDEENLEKFCSVVGYAYTIVDKGEMVIPRLETMTHSMVNFFSDDFI